MIYDFPMNRLLAACVALALQSPAAAAVKNPDTLVYATIGDSESYDPAWAYDTAGHLVIANVHEHLVDFKGSGIKLKDVEPVIATKVPTRANGLISADGLTYRFPIRKGVKFHDGSTLTPEDVRYSMLRFMLLDRDAGPSSLLLEPLLGVPSTRAAGKLIPGIVERAFKAVTIEGDTIVVRLPKPFAPFLTVLTGHVEIQSKAWCAAHGQWDGSPETAEKFNNPRREATLGTDSANGTGPYKLARYDKGTKQTTLTRFDGYWRGPAKIKNVVVRVIDEFATRKLMLTAGDVDSIYTPLMFANQMEKLPGVKMTEGLFMTEIGPGLFFNYKINALGNSSLGSAKLDGKGIPADFFSDKDVRKGFAYAVDSDAYIKDIQRGKGRETASFIPQGLLGHRDGKNPYSFDLAKSRAHFQKAWGGKVWEKGFTLSIVYNAGSPVAQAICQMVKKNVEAVNPKFQVDVRVLQWSSFLEQKQQGKLPVFVGLWLADYPDPHNFAFPMLHSSGYFGTSQHLSNKAFDELIEKAVRELDETKRAAMYAKLHEMWDEEAPSILIADGPRVRTERSWVKGFVFKPTFPDMPYGGPFYDLSKSE
jgi:peptide/nickel transport system substrate-binding protein